MADNKEKPVIKPVKPVIKPVTPKMDEEDYGPIPPEAVDKKQDWANQKAAEQYQKTKKFSKGGSASARADGCATRGKTKGRMV